MKSSKLAEKLVPPARFEHAAYGLGNRPLVVGYEGKRRVSAVMCPVCSGLSREHRGIKVHGAPGGSGCASIAFPCEKLCALVSARLRRPGTYRTDALVARRRTGRIPPRITPGISGCSL
jgi:hypothetical protein